MKTKRQARDIEAFSLVETIFGIALFGIASMSLLAGIIWVTSTVQSQRENLRATEIMTEKLDTIRLYSWTQLTNSGFISNTFQITFYPTNGVPAGPGTSSPGITYNGTLSITNLLCSESYSNTLKLVTVQLTWTSGKRPRQTQMST